MWHGSLLLQIGIFLYFARIIFAIIKVWFFLLDLKFCDFLEVAFRLQRCRILELYCTRLTSEITRRNVKHSNHCHYIAIIQ